MTTALAFLWIIGALFTLGICFSYVKHETSWYFYIAAPVGCLFCWPLLLGTFVGGVAR